MKFDISGMLTADVYDHPADSIELIETHISWVILTGEFAYKIKKPVNFGFLDFSTLEKRHAFCEQEIRLNRRLAPDIYIEVVAITGTHDKPHVSSLFTSDQDAAFEYAVKMRQFPQAAQLDHMLEAGELNLQHMDALASTVAEFHQQADIADSSTEYGSPSVLYHPVEENFQQIKQHLDTEQYADKLKLIKQWSETEFLRLASIFEQRKKDGFVRQCHGDMHLRNLIWLNNRPMAFDCIEFNPLLSWVDVMSEVAFLIMDLQDRQCNILANRFLNSYLQSTGDYAGLSVMSFYLCYRALVRAKVAALRLEQEHDSKEDRQQTLAEFESYLALASRYTHVSKVKLIITYGMSGAGKSTVSQQLTDQSGFIRIRSDVERKRLFDIELHESVSAEVNTSIYSEQASQQTYTKLLGLASQILTAGYSVIVDAAFLQYEQREVFRQLAEELNVSFVILEISAPFAVLKQRIINRTNDVSDADIGVLEYQCKNWKPLRKNEMDKSVRVDTGNTVDIKKLTVEIDAI